VEQAIRDQCTQLIANLQQQGKDAEQKLASAADQGRAGFASARAHIAPSIAHAVDSTVHQLTEAGAHGAQSIQHEGDGAAALFDKAEHDAHQKLTAGHHASADALDGFTGQVGGHLGQMRGTATDALGRQAHEGDRGVQQVAQSFDHTVATRTADARAQMAAGSAKLAEIDGVPAALDQACTQARTEALKGYRDSIKKAGDEAQKKIDEAERGYRERTQKNETEIKKPVDEHCSKCADVARDAPGKMNEVAKKAESEAKKSLFDQILS